MKAIDIEGALNGLTKNLNMLAKGLPQQMASIAKEMGAKDADMVNKALEDSDIINKMKELGIAEGEFRSFIKRF